MLANTQQVRAIAKQFCNVSAQYTDKTIKKSNTSKRRSVVFCLNSTASADALAQFLRNNITNKVTRTGLVEYGQYVRVIADLA